MLSSFQKGRGHSCLQGGFAKVSANDTQRRVVLCGAAAQVTVRGPSSTPASALQMPGAPRQPPRVTTTKRVCRRCPRWGTPTPERRRGLLQRLWSQVVHSTSHPGGEVGCGRFKSLRRVMRVSCTFLRSVLVQPTKERGERSQASAGSAGPQCP